MGFFLYRIRPVSIPARRAPDRFTPAILDRVTHTNPIHRPPPAARRPPPPSAAHHHHHIPTPPCRPNRTRPAPGNTSSASGTSQTSKRHNVRRRWSSSRTEQTHSCCRPRTSRASRAQTASASMSTQSSGCRWTSCTWLGCLTATKQVGVLSFVRISIY